MAIKDKPLKRINPDNPQIRSYTEAIRHGQNSYHVLPDEDGWRVKRIGDSRESNFGTQSEAVFHAEKAAYMHKSEVIIHGENGLIRDRHSVDSDPTPPRDINH